MEAQPPQSIGNYEILETLRVVPEGIIYKAVEKTSHSNVFIKIYFPSVRWSDEILNEFFNLTSYLQFMDHDGLLSILDVGTYEGSPYIVYPYDSQVFLEDRPAQLINQAETLDFFYKIVDALDFLHKQEIQHGLLNTENILIDSDNNPKVFDYGLSGVFKKLLLENMDDRFLNLSVSDIHCTSPEQLLGRNPTRQSDVYSLGVILYFCIYSQYPFEGITDSETVLAHLYQRAKPIPATPGKISRRLIAFIQKCIQVEPADRFKNLGEVLQVLDRLRQDRWVQFKFQKRIGDDRAKRARLQLGLSAVLLLSLVAGIVFFTKRSAAMETSTPFPTQMLPTETEPPATPSPEPVHTTTLAAVTEASTTQVIQNGAINKPAFQGGVPALPRGIIAPDSLADLREIARFGYGKPEDVDMTADGRYFALATSSGVFIFNGDTLYKWFDPQDWASNVEFSSNGDLLAVGLDSGDIQLWDWQNESKTSTLSGHQARISRIIFSSNDRLMYSASYDHHIFVWDMNQQGIIKDIDAHSVPINDIAVSADGITLVSCADDQLIRVLNLASGTKLYQIPFTGHARAVAISSDGVYVAAGGENGLIRQWDIKTPRQDRTDVIPVKQRIWSLQYFDNDASLLAGIDNGKTQVFKADQEKYPGISLSFRIPSLSSPLIKIFGSHFRFDSFAVTNESGNTTLSIRWDGMVTSNGGQVLAPLYDSIDRLDFSNDGTYLAASGKRELISVWNTKTGEIVYQGNSILPPGDPFSPNGSTLAMILNKSVRVSGSSSATTTQGVYQLINLTSPGASPRELSQVIPGGVVSYTGDGSILISGNLRQSKVWDFASGYEAFFTSHPDSGCLITSSSNNGEILQVNSVVGILPAWDDLSKRICAKTFQHLGTLIAISRDVSLIAHQNSDGLIEGFDVGSSQVIWKYQPEGDVTALAVSPEGSIVALGTSAGKMVLINGTNGEDAGEFTGNFAGLQALAFSEDGMKIATAGYDGTVRLYAIPDTK